MLGNYPRANNSQTYAGLSYKQISHQRLHFHKSININNKEINSDFFKRFHAKPIVYIQFQIFYISAIWYTIHIHIS